MLPFIKINESRIIYCNNNNKLGAIGICQKKNKNIFFSRYLLNVFS